MHIRAMKAEDWEEVSKIYADGIAGRNATFETSVPSWEVWDGKYLKICRLVAEEDGKILGFTALGAVSARDCYRGVTENTIYVANDTQGKGVGSALMQALIDESEANGIWMILATTFDSNTTSIAFHQKFGFRTIGYRERIAQLDGIWRNTVMLERRSPVIGND